MGESQVPKFRRRRYIVDRKLQYRFIAVMLLMFVFFSAIALATVYLTLWMTLQTFELEQDPLMVALFTTVGLSLILELLIVAPFIVWGGVLMTHRVAGPLVRIHAALGHMTDGKYDVRISLRKGDLLDDLAEHVNELAAALRSR